MDDKRIYYVYEWYNVETGDIFYVGKGHGDRYKQKGKTKRNRYFYNYIKKYKCSSRIIIQNLTEKEAYEKEHETILKCRSFGYKLTNFDDGGHVGGSCPGELNPMYGKTHTKEAGEKIRQANLGGKNAKENNSQWRISPKQRMSDDVYNVWRKKQKDRKFGSSNPNSHPVIVYDINHIEIMKFGNITECCKWFIENENLDTNVENFRSKLKYYNKNENIMMKKYFIKIIRPNKNENTVPSLTKEEGVTTTKSITQSKSLCEEASRVEDV